MSGSRCICILCKRKFKSAELLTRHRQLSELHRTNLVKQEEEAQRSKDELRQVIASFRTQLQELEAAASKRPKTKDELLRQRVPIEEKLQGVLIDYGQLQEQVEARRHQLAAERLPGPGPCAPTFKPSEVSKMRCGPLQLSAGASSWQGNKDFQEDRFILKVELTAPGGGQVVGCCVLDGHSGSLCVDWLVEWLPRNLQTCLSGKASFSEEKLKEAVVDACAQTDNAFLSEARRREVLDGTTMCICLIYNLESGAISKAGKGGYRLLVANVGDSRAVLCRSQGQGRRSAVRLSDDHKPGRADERRRIEKQGGVVDMAGVWRVYIPGHATFAGRSVQWGLAVSRAFGDILMKEPDRYGCVSTTGALVTAKPEITTFDLHPGEDRFIVLACDGVWDVLEDDDAVALCLKHRSVEQAAHAVVRRAFEVGSDDNITAAVLSWHLRDEALDGEPAGDGKRRRT